MDLNGRKLAFELNKALKGTAAGLSRRPGLAVVLVGRDPASEIYVAKKGKVAGRLGFEHRQIDMDASSTLGDVLEVIDDLNTDPNIDGILVQLPLPNGLDATAVMDRIEPDKDVDGFTIGSTGRLSQGRPVMVPCTPLGIMKMLEQSEVALSGKEAVIIGRSNIVGRPMAMLLEQQNCTVTVCHSRTQSVADHVRRADVVVAAVGRPHFVKGEWVKEGAIVIDVGINRLEDGTLTGDVDYEGAKDKAAWITPVPGGVGPMTIAMLMENTYQASKRRQE
jgi:methylenetetrahydrofolate dehydrogenase (NADP+) / methenyltetrahydrofolate cyclohydrolase